MVKQLSVFVENKPGRLMEVLQALAERNIDIKALSLADTTEFGIIRMVVSNAEAAVKRYDAYTVFECKIPWSEVFQEGFVPKSGQVLRFSLMANDNDGNSRRGWIEYTSGIGYEKLVTDFGSLVLSK